MDVYRGYGERARKALERAEGDFRRLIGEAAEMADYSAVTVLLAAAQALDNLKTVFKPANQTVEAVFAEKTPGVDLSARRTASSYPYFLRDENVLVKVGWSKTGRTEYEHKAPKAFVDLLVARIAGRSGRNARFTTDHIFPLKEADGSAVPDYQSYLCLAWLCSIGVVERDGRQGYRVLKTPLEALTESAWSSLEVRQ